MRHLLLAAMLMCAAAAALLSRAPSVKDWIDPSTGHRIVRLTNDAGGSTLYFHDNAFSPEGDKMMFNTPPASPSLTSRRSALPLSSP